MEVDLPKPPPPLHSCRTLQRLTEEHAGGKHKADAAMEQGPAAKPKHKAVVAKKAKAAWIETQASIC